MYSEIQHNNLFLSVSRQNVCPKELAIVMTLVSKTTFLNPLRGGNFFYFFEFDNAWRYSLFTRWHSRGAFSISRGRISKNTHISSFKISTLWSMFMVTPSIGDASFLACAYFMSGFSFDMQMHLLGTLFHQLLNSCSFQAHFSHTR